MNFYKYKKGVRDIYCFPSEGKILVIGIKTGNINLYDYVHLPQDDASFTLLPRFDPLLMTIPIGPTNRDIFRRYLIDD